MSLSVWHVMHVIRSVVDNLNALEGTIRQLYSIGSLQYSRCDREYWKENPRQYPSNPGQHSYTRYSVFGCYPETCRLVQKSAVGDDVDCYTHLNLPKCQEVHPGNAIVIASSSRTPCCHTNYHGFVYFSNQCLGCTRKKKAHSPYRSIVLPKPPKIDSLLFRETISFHGGTCTG